MASNLLKRDADFKIENGPSFQLKNHPKQKDKSTFLLIIKEFIKEGFNPLAIIVAISAILILTSVPKVKDLSSGNEQNTQEETTTVSIQKTQAFLDVSPSSRYYKAIESLFNKGVIQGLPNGKFLPENLITRAQFAKMIVLTFNLYPTEQDWEDSNPLFKDLGPDDPNSLYPHEYIAMAFKNHITEGIKPGEFGPNNYITRAQMMTMIIRATDNLMPEKLKEAPSFYKNSLGNFSSVHAIFAKKFQYNLLGKNVINGPDWNPMLSATRGEAAQMLYNLLSHTGETEMLFPITINGETEIHKTAIIDTIKSCFLDYNALLKPHQGITITIKDLGDDWDGQYLGHGDIELNSHLALPELREDLEHEVGHILWELLPPSAWQEWHDLVGNGNGSNDWHYIPLEHFAESFRISFYPTHANFPIKTKLKVLSQEEMRKWVMDRLPSNFF
jgi:hypothetical protein